MFINKDITLRWLHGVSDGHLLDGKKSMPVLLTFSEHSSQRKSIAFPAFLPGDKVHCFYMQGYVLSDVHPQGHLSG